MYRNSNKFNWKRPHPKSRPNKCFPDIIMSLCFSSVIGPSARFLLIGDFCVPKSVLGRISDIWPLNANLAHLGRSTGTAPNDYECCKLLTEAKSDLIIRFSFLHGPRAIPGTGTDLLCSWMLKACVMHRPTLIMDATTTQLFDNYIWLLMHVFI